MAWCDGCDKYVEMQDASEKSCPTCDAELDTADAAFKDDDKPPWHFWLIFVALCGYLLWRVVVFIL